MKNKNIYKNQATLISIPHNYRPRVFCVKKTKKISERKNFRNRNFQNEKISETKKQSKLLFGSLFQAKKKNNLGKIKRYGDKASRTMFGAKTKNAPLTP